jgi:hypothetical protein
MQDRYRRIDKILLRRTAGPYIGSKRQLVYIETFTFRPTVEGGMVEVPPRPLSAISIFHGTTADVPVKSARRSASKSGQLAFV